MPADPPKQNATTSPSPVCQNFHSLRLHNQYGTNESRLLDENSRRIVTEVYSNSERKEDGHILPALLISSLIYQTLRYRPRHYRRNLKLGQ